VTVTWRLVLVTKALLLVTVTCRLVFVTWRLVLVTKALLLVTVTCRLVFVTWRLVLVTWAKAYTTKLFYSFFSAIANTDSSWGEFLFSASP